MTKAALALCLSFSSSFSLFKMQRGTESGEVFLFTFIVVRAVVVIVVFVEMLLLNKLNLTKN